MMYLETSAKGQVLEKVTSVPDCWTGVFYYSKALNFFGEVGLTNRNEWIIIKSTHIKITE